MGRGRKRTWTDEQLVQIVAESFTHTEVVERLGLRSAGGNFGCIKKHIRRLNISTVHFQSVERRKRKESWKDEEVFCEASKANGKTARKRVLRRGLLKEQCAHCGQGTTHNGKPLTLQLDHINGRNRDHRIENLRFLCPNCHSQTETWGGRNKRTDWVS